METDAVAKDEGEWPFEGGRSLSSLVGSEKVELSLGVVLVSAWEGGWATLQAAPALDNSVVNPYFGRRQFSGKRDRGLRQSGEVEQQERARKQGI